jgi:hypothetical protein
MYSTLAVEKERKTVKEKERKEQYIHTMYKLYTHNGLENHMYADIHVHYQ